MAKKKVEYLEGDSDMNKNREENTPKTSDFTRLLGVNPRIKVLNFFIKTKDFDYGLSSIAEGAGINRNTAREIIDEFLKEEIIKKTRILGKSQLYKINNESPKIKALIKFHDEIINENIDFAVNQVKKEECDVNTN